MSLWSSFSFKHHRSPPKCFRHQDHRHSQSLPLRTACQAGWWWRMSLIPALGRQRQVDPLEFKANLVYRVSSRTARDTQRNPILKNQNRETKSWIPPHCADCSFPQRTHHAQLWPGQQGAKECVLTPSSSSIYFCGSRKEKSVPGLDSPLRLFVCSSQDNN